MHNRARRCESDDLVFLPVCRGQNTGALQWGQAVTTTLRLCPYAEWRLNASRRFTSELALVALLTCCSR